MKIETARFGEVDVPEERLIQFVEPILGFEESGSYVLLEHAEDSPFNWLQSAQEPELAFVVTHPKLFNIDYDVSIPDEIVERLSLSAPEDVLILNIVNIPAENPSLMTANLLGPVVINQNQGIAMQVVLHESSYSTKTRLIPDPSGTGAMTMETSVTDNNDDHDPSPPPRGKADNVLTFRSPERGA